MQSVLRVARSAEGFKSVSVHESPRNKGLSASLTTGIDSILARSERVIVLEDDLIVSEWFLQYMNDHLELYATDEKVASIHGYVYPHPTGVLPDTFFIRGADCWGWATWRRAWQKFNPDGRMLLQELRRQNLLDAFDFGGTAPYQEMLIDQIAGRNDSWAVRWYASALLAGMVTLYPDTAMAVNVGEDGSGSHGGSTTAYVQELATGPLRAVRIPSDENPEARAMFEAFFSRRYRLPPSPLGRLAWRYARRVKQRITAGS